MNSKRKKIIIVVSCVLLVVIIIVSLSFYMKHINSTQYKLKKLGYNDEEIKILIEKDKVLDIALKEYNDSLQNEE